MVPLGNLSCFNPDQDFILRLTQELIRPIVEILLLILTSRNRTHFSRWTLIEPSVLPKGETSVYISGFVLSPFISSANFDHGGHNICIAEENSKIVVVNSDRVLYELDLSLSIKKGTLAPPASGNPPYRPYCQREYRISSNGCRLAGIFIRCPKCSDPTMSERREEHSKSPISSKTHMELMFVDLSGAADQKQRLYLEYIDTEFSAFHYHAVTFSPDLSMMQVGPHIFDLLASDLVPLSFPDSPLGKPGLENIPSMSFSSCNDYLIVTEGKGAIAEAEPATFGLFRIFRTAGTIEKLVIAALNVFTADAISGQFHPTLLLLMLTWISRQGSDVEGSASKDIGKTIIVAEIDLLEARSVPISIPKHDLSVPDK